MVAVGLIEGVAAAGNNEELWVSGGRMGEWAWRQEEGGRGCMMQEGDERAATWEDTRRGVSRGTSCRGHRAGGGRGALDQ